jgi:soluble lytic murein transglycosylase
VKSRAIAILLLLAAMLLAAILVTESWRWHQKRDHSHDEVILFAARRYGVEPALVKAVVWRESRFDAAARGRAGELGLMQIRAAAAQDWAKAENLPDFRHEALLEPTNNVLAGAWYLSHLLKRYPHTDHPLTYALADYNAGRTHVLRWAKDRAATNSAEFLARMDFPGTRKYIEIVLRRCEHYRPIFPPPR